MKYCVAAIAGPKKTKNQFKGESLVVSKTSGYTIWIHDLVSLSPHLFCFVENAKSNRYDARTPSLAWLVSHARGVDAKGG